MIAAYEADARSMVEELLAKALEIKEARRRPGGMLGKIFVQPPFERSQLLDRAESWLKALSEPGDLPARIEKARKEALSAK
ncbi:MAG: hypothetical protein M0D55_05075 [Elusimicrobiota bacterium]|nr:MAG: hypothetical protein M0D55_05075 [Elusimicrobiota bacterium]